MLKNLKRDEASSSQQQKVFLLDRMYEYQVFDRHTKNLLMREVQQNNIDPISFLLHSNLSPIEQIEVFLHKALNISSIDLSTSTIQPNVLDMATADAMLAHGMIPFKLEKNVLCVAMDQPYFREKIIKAEELFDGMWAVQPFFCKNMNVSEVIDCQLTHANKVEPLISQLCSAVSDDSNTVMVSPDLIIIKLVEGILLEAMEERASDIHFDSNAYFIKQRLRIDGVLIEKRKFNLDIWSSIKIRLKVLSNIDITESILPQDGAFFIRLRNQNYDFRLSSIPSIHGECIVLRLNSHKNIVQLEDLGFDNELNQTLKKLIKQPSGLILIGGPTGSGKTTTLYALLQTLNLNAINIATLEDPVEHMMPNIRQTNIAPELGLGFAQGIRSLLRQDPDILLIGEIRDAESAELAIKASLTGRLVLATVHSAYIKDIPHRMLNLLGENNSSLYSQTLAIMAQRLLRKLCHLCGGESCDHCNQSGYYGRFSIMEYLIFDENRLSDDFDQYHYQGLTELAKQAIHQKLTDRDEVERVMGELVNFG